MRGFARQELVARHHNPVSCAVAHAVLKVIKAGRRLVLISATGMKGRSEDPPAAGILVEGC
jgi:hypothetical protein